MSQKGLIIGFANQQRKRVLQSYNSFKAIFDNSYMIQKEKGFIGDCKEEIQKEIIQMISQHSTVNTIYIILKYQRIDNMRKQLSLIMEHFQNYVNNIYLVVANFQISKDKQKDQESIRSKLVQQHNLKNYFQYQFGQTFDQDSIYFDSQEIMGEDIIHYFNKTICQRITFDGNLMNLYPKINYQLLQEIEQYINSNKGTSDQTTMQINYNNKVALQTSNEFENNQSNTNQETSTNDTLIETTASTTLMKNQLESENYIQQNQIQENNNDPLENKKIEQSLQNSLKNNDNKISKVQLSKNFRKHVIQIKGESKPYLLINFKKLEKKYLGQHPSMCSSSLKCLDKYICKLRAVTSPIKQDQLFLKNQNKLSQNSSQITKVALQRPRTMINSMHNNIMAFGSNKKVFH